MSLHPSYDLTALSFIMNPLVWWSLFENPDVPLCAWVTVKAFCEAQSMLSKLVKHSLKHECWWKACQMRLKRGQSLCMFLRGKIATLWGEQCIWECHQNWCWLIRVRTDDHVQMWEEFVRHFWCELQSLIRLEIRIWWAKCWILMATARIASDQNGQIWWQLDAVTMFLFYLYVKKNHSIMQWSA